MTGFSPRAIVCLLAVSWTFFAAHADSPSPYGRLASEEQQILKAIKVNSNTLAQDLKRQSELLAQKQKLREQATQFLSDQPPTPANSTASCDTACRPDFSPQDAAKTPARKRKRAAAACEMSNFRPFPPFSPAAVSNAETFEQALKSRPSCLYLFRLANQTLEDPDGVNTDQVPGLTPTCSDAVLSCSLVRKQADESQTRAAELAQLRAEIHINQDLSEEYAHQLAEIRQKMSYWAVEKNPGEEKSPGKTAPSNITPADARVPAGGV